MSWARLGTVQPEQLFAGEAEGVLLVHRRDVVEAVEIADGLQVGLVLDQLLGAAMQQADVRIDAVHHLAVQLQHQAQHAVRGRMLRPEVDVELADSSGIFTRSVRPSGSHLLHAVPVSPRSEPRLCRGFAFIAGQHVVRPLPTGSRSRRRGTPASASPARRPRASASSS